MWVDQGAISPDVLFFERAAKVINATESPAYSRRNLVAVTAG
jgi:hypothetical protein